MESAAFQIALRYLHVAAAVVLVGGMTFLSIALKPSARLLADADRKRLMDAVQERFKRVVYLCFAVLAASGFYNWMLLADAYRGLGPRANAVIGIKVLLALIAFAIIWSRSIGLLKLPGKACHLINLHLAAIIILLAGLLRYWRQGG